MRIVSWNMAGGFGYDATRHDRAWQYLRSLDPDVALLQEAVPPTWAAEHWSIVAHRKYGPRAGRDDVSWGSAIVARGSALTALEPDNTTPWLDELRGCAVIARLDGEEPLWLASVHSNAYPLSADRLSARSTEGMRRCDETDVWEIELIALEFERLVRKQRFIVGGDLNSAVLFDTKYGRQSNARLFSNLREAGFIDLRNSEREEQTYFKDGKGPYQLDHIFADEATAAAAHSWRVLPEPARELYLSDHAPIEVTFAARAAGQLSDAHRLAVNAMR